MQHHLELKDEKQPANEQTQFNKLPANSLTKMNIKNTPANLMNQRRNILLRFFRKWSTGSLKRNGVTFELIHIRYREKKLADRRLLTVQRYLHQHRWIFLTAGNKLLVFIFLYDSVLFICETPTEPVQSFGAFNSLRHEKCRISPLLSWWPSENVKVNAEIYIL